jgi:periplasmic mercuric ion binding protein
MKNIIFYALIALIGWSACAQKNNVTPNQTAQFEVWGNCGMCKKTIEKAANNVAGVATATWDKNTHQFTVAFDTVQTSKDKVHQAIAAAGYDTDQLRADDAAYQNLHSCCQYERRK